MNDNVELLCCRRPYRAEGTRSLPTIEIKRRRIQLVLGGVNAVGFDKTCVCTRTLRAHHLRRNSKQGFAIVRHWRLGACRRSRCVARGFTVQADWHIQREIVANAANWWPTHQNVACVEKQYSHIVCKCDASNLPG